MKNSDNTIGNRTRDLPDCCAVPEPTAPPRNTAEYTEKYKRRNGDGWKAVSQLVAGKRCSCPVHVTKECGRIRRIPPRILNDTLFTTSGQLHALTALAPLKEQPGPIVNKVQRTAGLFQMFQKIQHALANFWGFPILSLMCSDKETQLSAAKGRPHKHSGYPQTLEQTKVI